jgi:alkylation response protein AidB-like acyl-CoA dehydrogenase
MTVPAARAHSLNSCRLDQRLIEVCASADRWPLPGHGRTARRFALLIGVAARDLVLGRLVEAHADAVAIAAELAYRGRENGQRWGVWAAGPPDGVTATRIGGRWVLEGVKSWCSGASLVTHALVDASAPDGQRLFAVPVRAPGVRLQPASWSGPGMQRSDTRSLAFDRVVADPVGKPDLVAHSEPDFRLDSWCRDRRSPAARAGLV